MLAIKSYSNLRLIGRVSTCHSNAQLMVGSKVTKIPLQYGPLCRALHQDRRNAVTSSLTSRSGGRYWPTVMLLMGCAYGIYNFQTSGPLLLQGHEPPEKDEYSLSFQHLKDHLRYVTMDFVNFAFKVKTDSRLIDPQCGIHRCDTVAFPSKYENECQVKALRIKNENQEEGADIDWSSFELYDAHAGPNTADLLMEVLLRYIAALVPTTVQQNSRKPEDKSFGHASPDPINEAIKFGFLLLDYDIIQLATQAISGSTALYKALPEVEPANTGSCALVAIYDVVAQLLRVANVGNSRAVLGRRNAAEEWEAIPLSVDQTASDVTEATRIKAEHPDEPNVIENGQVLGMAVSRAFGDLRWKVSQKIQQVAQRRFFGPPILSNCLTPPYLTAEPVITTTKIELEKGDFLILASKGLWDHLTNEQAVGLVGRWLKQNDVHHMAPEYDFLSDTGVLEQIRSGPPADDPGPGRAYTETRFADEKHFVVVDDNAAAHLVRNAFGGDREDLLRALISVSASNRIHLIDDVTAQVVFFGEKKAHNPAKNIIIRNN